MMPLSRPVLVLSAALVLAGCTAQKEGGGVERQEAQQKKAVETLGNFVAEFPPIHPDGDPARVMLGIAEGYGSVGASGVIGHRFQVQSVKGPAEADLVEGKVANMQMVLSSRDGEGGYQIPVCVRMLISEDPEAQAPVGSTVGVTSGADEGRCE